MRNAKVVIVAVTAGVLAVVGLAARISHPSGTGSAGADPTRNLTQFSLEDEDFEDELDDEDITRGAVLAPSIGPPAAATGTS